METTQQLTTKTLFEKDTVKKRIEEMLGKKASGFITSVLQIVASNDLLKNADPMSVYNAAIVAATLDLPLNNNLGFAYIIPYNQKFQDNEGKWQTKQVAQFQLGYKAFIQLAQRSGQFKTISATPIYEGQIVENNPLTGIVFDFTKKLSEKPIGYASYFELLNGFQKTFYMTVEEMEKHGKRFSKTYASGRGIWKEDFDSMAIKTVIKLLLSKYAPLSVDMQKAVVTDQSVINNETATDVTHVDVTDGIERTDLEIAEEKIIEGLETYRGGDKDKIQNECVEAKQTGEWNMDFAKKIAKKLEIEL